MNKVNEQIKKHKKQEEKQNKNKNKKVRYLEQKTTMRIGPFPR